MNIAIYQPRVSYYVGGGEILPLEHGIFLKKLGHKITIITTRAPFIKESGYFRNYKKNNKNIGIDYIDLPRSLKRIYKIKPGENWARWNQESISVGRLARKYFLEHRFDLITVYNVLDMRAVPQEQKSVLHLLGYPEKIGALYKNCLRFPDGIIAVSKYVKNRWLGMSDIKKIAVAANGIESGQFRPMGGRYKKYDVLFVGRLIKIKGVDYLLKAVDILKKEGVDLKIAITGDGPEKNNLELFAKRLGLNSSVNFLGHVKSDKLVGLYNSAKMTVLPSYDREGLMITMLESSACGTPVITTTACSMREFIKNKKNGILVKPKNAADLAKAIGILSGDDKLRRRLSKNAKTEITKNWRWEIKIKKVDKIYEKLLSNR